MMVLTIFNKDLCSGCMVSVIYREILELRLQVQQSCFLLFFPYLLSKVQFSSVQLLAQHLLSSVYSLLYTSAFI